MPLLIPLLKLESREAQGEALGEYSQELRFTNLVESLLRVFLGFLLIYRK